MPNTLFIGAKHPIALELVRQLKADGEDVIAGVRKPEDANGLAEGAKVLAVDVLDKASVDAAAKQVDKLDTLIVFPVIDLVEQLSETSDDRMAEFLNSNVLGLHRIVLAFLPALRKGAKKQLIIITSNDDLGSDEKNSDNPLATRGPFAVTNAANNAQAYQLHLELKSEGFTVVSLHPISELNEDGTRAHVEPAKSVEGMLGVIKTLNIGSGEHHQTWDDKGPPYVRK